MDAYEKLEFEVTNKPLPLQSLMTYVDVSFSLNHLMRRLQAEKGGFSYLDLAGHLEEEFDLSEQQAKEMTWQFVSNMNALIQYDGQQYHLAERRPPTIDETITNLKILTDMKPRRPRRSIVAPSPIPRRTGLTPDLSTFEKFRPKRDRSVGDAPESVMACYDNADKGDARYTIVLGGKMWTPHFARSNWQAGVDPRVTLCVTLSAHPTAPNGVVLWGHIMPGTDLGRKIVWSDLPPHVRMHIADRILR